MANNPSDLIQFKRGTMANLETLITNKGGIDGTFYLTIDDDATTDVNNPSRSSRLFVGRADGSIVPVNQGIITVSTINDLTNNINAKWHAGDYAYVTDSNILAIYDGQKWKQINQVGTDTFVKVLTDNVSTTGGVTTVETDALMNDGTTHKKASFTLTGDKGITVDSTGTDITITGDEYTLSSDAVVSGSDTAIIKLSSDNKADAGSIEISKKANSLITVEGAADHVVIGVVDKSPRFTTLSNETNGFGLVITKADGSTTDKATIDPTITYGDNAASTAHFQNGVAALDIYNKSDIDDKLKGLNAMTYRGTVGDNGSVATSLTGVTSASIGDTFKASSAFTGIPIKEADGTISNTGSVKTGDLLIANSLDPEDANGKIVTNRYFDIIPSGDDIEDTTYRIASKDHGITIVPSTGAAIGSIALATGSDNLITLSDSGTTDKTVTVGHNTVTTNASTGTAIAQNASAGRASVTVAAVTGVTTDGYGHVTDVETTNVTLTDTNATLSSVTNTVTAGTGNDAGKKVSVKTEAKLNHSNGTTIDTKSDSFDIISDNLTITASGKQVQANFLWGTF